MPELDLTGELVGDSDDKPEPKRVRTQAAKAAQAERVRALTAEGYTVVRGPSGLTVFDFGGLRHYATHERNKTGTSAVNIITKGN